MAGPFKRCVVIVNPVSTHADRAERRIAQLRKLFKPDSFHVIKTSAAGKATNRGILTRHAELFGPGTLLCIAAGDGTINTVVEWLMLDPHLPRSALKTTVLPIWGGNANDLAHMLNGSGARYSMAGLLKAAQTVTVHPLACTFTDPKDKTKKRIAVSYMSLGASAFATRHMGKQSHRNHPLRRLHLSRYIFEFITGARAFGQAPGFTVKEHNREELVYERIISNGPRMAKTSGMPARLTEPAFYMHTLHDKRPIAAIPSLIRSRQPKHAPKTMHMHTSFTITEPTLAQLDGELITVPAGTHVKVEPSKKSLLMLSTRLS